ncbi:MAG: hypothetical protein M1816_002206 [Peltula sp. TS41687]|nr:MAG: hypothetical protein M1816_002206 [Peltula sp. TS41687]
MAEHIIALDDVDHLRAANAAKKLREALGSHQLSKARVLGTEDLRVARELLAKRKEKSSGRKRQLPAANRTTPAKRQQTSTPQAMIDPALRHDPAENQHTSNGWSEALPGMDLEHLVAADVTYLDSLIDDCSDLREEYD